MRMCAGVVLSVLAVTALPAAAEPPTELALFEVSDVNRDAVPAGTPEAFWAAFGKPQNAFRASRWYQTTREVNGQVVTYVPLTLIPLPGGRVALVSTGASDCDGHACSGVNSVHYLQRDTRAWRYTAVGEWLDVGASGTFGNPASRWGWSDAIAEAPVLYTEGGGVWQGYACSHASLTELMPAGPVEIASIQISYSDEGAVGTGSTRLEGRITAAEQGRSFTVTYTGSRAFRERYVRGADGRYQVVGRTDVPGC